MNGITHSPITIIHSTDGGVDDFATSALIAAAYERDRIHGKPSFAFSAVVITNADCEPKSALSAYLKTFNLFDLSTRVGLSSSRVWNAFPWAWRMDSEAVDKLDCLKNREVIPLSSALDGDSLLANLLKTSENVKIIATGPLTSIADTLKNEPQLISKISDIHWMGGALDVPGNIMESPEIPKTLLNDKAEWNVFSDPQSVDWIFKETQIKIHLYPIDISNHTIPKDFIKVLEKKEPTLYSKFVTECYQIVEKAELYRMWDVVAAGGIFFPEVFAPPVKEKICVEVGGENEGALIRNKLQGRKVLVYKEFKNNDPSLFYEAVAKILALEK